MVRGREPWTAEEDFVLRNSTAPLAMIAQQLDRSISAVQGRRFVLGITRRKPAWTTEEDRYIQEHHHERIIEIARALGRTQSATQQRKVVLGLADAQDHEPWTQKDEEYLRAHLDTPAEACAGALGRSVQAIWARRHRLGLHVRQPAGSSTPRAETPPAAPAHRRQWQPTEDNYIRAHPDMPAARIGAVLGRTAKAVRARRWVLGTARHTATAQEAPNATERR